MQKRGRLVLADGVLVQGSCLYESDDIVTGELVFSTATTGYTEILTDPSFFGQIVVLANPEIGNYGVNINDFQSSGAKVRGIVVRNLSSCASSFRAQMTLQDFLLREQIPILYGVDTRALIAHLRDHGSVMAVLTKNASLHSQDLLARARALPPLEHEKLSDAVSVKAHQNVSLCEFDLEGRLKTTVCENKFHIVALDFGIKHGLIHYLQHVGGRITLVPNDATAEDIWSLAPDGLFLSNGPGDPQKETQAVAAVRSLLGKLPIFGVCMGHQVLAQVLGLSTYKLKFGHRGSNQAVKCVDGRLITTAQNHGFAVDVQGVGREYLVDTNISDGTNEGIDLPHLFAFSVQFHPEGAPGPLDSLGYFEKFANNMREWKRRKSTVVDGQIRATPKCC